MHVPDVQKQLVLQVSALIKCQLAGRRIVRCQWQVLKLWQLSDGNPVQGQQKAVAQSSPISFTLVPSCWHACYHCRQQKEMGQLLGIGGCCTACAVIDYNTLHAFV